MRGGVMKRLSAITILLLLAGLVNVFSVDQTNVRIEHSELCPYGTNILLIDYDDDGTWDAIEGTDCEGWLMFIPVNTKKFDINKYYAVLTAGRLSGETKNFSLDLVRPDGSIAGNLNFDNGSINFTKGHDNFDLGDIDFEQLVEETEMAGSLYDVSYFVNIPKLEETDLDNCIKMRESAETEFSLDKINFEECHKKFSQSRAVIFTPKMDAGYFSLNDIDFTEFFDSPDLQGEMWAAVPNDAGSFDLEKIDFATLYNDKSKFDGFIVLNKNKHNQGFNLDRINFAQYYENESEPDFEPRDVYFHDFDISEVNFEENNPDFPKKIDFPKEKEGVEIVVQHQPEITISPNPVRNEGKVLYEIFENTNANLAVYDANGKLVNKIFEGYLSAGTYSEIIDVSQLPNGAYIIRLMFDGNVISARFTVSK
jgi:hypothetical protein